MKKIILRNQQGFTLIEIIAVLIILGILAAVAIPRYFSMQDSARQAAVDGALAAGSGQLNMVYAKNLVNGISVSNGIADLTNPQILEDGEDVGDFDVTYSGTGTADITIGFTTSTTNNPSWLANFNGTKTKVVPAPWR